MAGKRREAAKSAKTARKAGMMSKPGGQSKCAMKVAARRVAATEE